MGSPDVATFRGGLSTSDKTTPPHHLPPPPPHLFPCLSNLEHKLNKEHSYIPFYSHLFLHCVISRSEPNSHRKCPRIWTIQVLFTDITRATCPGCHGGGRLGSVLCSLDIRLHVGCHMEFISEFI